MAEEGERLPFKENEFIITGNLWLLAPAPRPADLTELCESVLLVDAILAEGRKRSYVPVFTELDLAYRFIERHGEGIEGLEPFSCRSPERFAGVLQKMLELGCLYVGFDPEETHVQLFPITAVIAALHGGE